MTGVTRDELDDHDGWAESRELEGGGAMIELVGKGKENKVRRLIMALGLEKINMSRLGLRDPFQIE